MAMNNVGKLLGAFIVILIGTVLIEALANDVHENTNLAAQPNESVTMASRAGTLANDDVTGITMLRNSSHADYLWLASTIGFNYTTGGAIVANASLPSTPVYVGYNYEDDLYVVDATSRTLLNLVLIFFAIAIMAIGVGMAISSFRSMGII